MKYYAKVDVHPTPQKPRHLEMLPFEWSEAEPFTPWSKAVEMYGTKGDVIEVIPEEEL